MTDIDIEPLPDDDFREQRLQPDAGPGSRAEYYLGEREDPLDPDDEGSVPAVGPVAAPGFAATTAAGSRSRVVGQHNWIPVGPRNIGGRITSLVIDPIDPKVVYAGTAGGGPYKTVDGGDTWFPLFHEQPSMSVGAIDISRGNRNRIWLATGDPRPGDNIVIRGNGIYRSDDGGTTWHNPVGPPGAAKPFGFAFEALAADPIDVNSCWAVGSAGVFRTRDAGVTWHRFSGTDDFDWWDVVFSPATTGLRPVYLVRTGGFRVTGGLVIRLDDPRAADAAITPLLVDPGDPAVALPASYMEMATSEAATRGRFAVAPSNPDIAYVRYTKANRGHLAMFSTTNARAAAGSVAWTPVPDDPEWLVVDGDGAPREGQGEYNLTVAVSPANPNHVATAMLDLHVTRFGTNHGTRPAAHPMWIRAMAWEMYETDRGQHGDHHALTFGPPPAAELWNGNDGGISVSSDAFSLGSDGATPRVGYTAKTSDNGSPQTLPLPPNVVTWRKRSHGLNVSLPYSLAQSPIIPQLYGCGYQDNGVFITTGGETWDFIVGADGGFIAFHPDDPYQMYVTWQGGIAHVERPGRVEVALPTPGETFRDAVWPRRVRRGFLQDDAALFVADTAYDQRSAGRVLHARRNRLYGLRPATGEQWVAEHAGRSLELWVEGDRNGASISVRPSTAAGKLGIEPQTDSSDANHPAVIRSLRPGPHALASGDQLDLHVNGTALPPVTFTTRAASAGDPGLDLSRPLSVGEVAAEISRALSGVTRFRALATFWPMRGRLDIITDAAGPDPGARITISEADGGADALGVSPGVYTPAPGHPAVVRIYNRRDVSNTGGPDRKFRVQIGTGAVRELVLREADFADWEDVQVGELGAKLSALLSADPVRVQPNRERRRVRLQADAGVNLRFSRDSRDLLGLPNSTGSGGSAATTERPDLSPDDLHLAISDGTNAAFVVFDVDSAADRRAITPAELHAVLSGEIAASSLAATVALVGADVRITANAGTTLGVVGTARTRLGLGTSVASAATVAVSGNKDVENRNWRRLRIRHGSRTADITFDPAVTNIVDLRRVQPTELLRVVAAAVTSAGLRGRVDLQSSHRTGAATEIAHDRSRPGRVWVGGVDGDAYASADGGTTWRPVAECAGAQMRRKVEAIAFHPTADRVVYLAVWGNFGDESEKVLVTPANDPGFLFRSDDDGGSWTHIGDDVAGAGGNRVPVNSLAVDPAEPDAVYAGTFVGVFRSTDRGANWVPFNENLPNARVSDLVFEPRSRTLRVALWGRSVFERHVGTRAPRDVHLYLRATAHDAGINRGTIVGPDLDAPQPATELALRSPDVKLLAAVPVGLGFIDGVEFDEDLVHEPPAAGSSAIAVQVHNRGAFEAADVRVVVLFADATLGPPELPDDFIALLAAGDLPEAVGDWTVLVDDRLTGTAGSAQDHVFAAQPRVLATSVEFPAEIEGFGQLGLVTLVTCPDDPFTSTETKVSRLLQSDRHVAYRETVTVPAADRRRVQLVGRIRDRVRPFNVSAPASDSALTRLGLATANGLRTVTGIGTNADGTFDLSGGGGSRGVTLSYADVTLPVVFRAVDLGGNARVVLSWEVRNVLNREFMEARLPLRSDTVGTGANRRVRIHGRGSVTRLGGAVEQAVRVSVNGGDVRPRLGFPNAGTPAATIRGSREGGGGFNLAVGDRTLNVVLSMSHTVWFDAVDFGDLANATADEIRRVINRDMRGLGFPLEAVVPRVDLRVQRSATETAGSAGVIGRAGLAEIVASAAAVAEGDRAELFGLPAALGDDRLVAGENRLYVRSTNRGNASQPGARLRVWEAKVPDDPTAAVPLDEIGDTVADLAAGGSVIAEFTWTPTSPAPEAGQRRVVLAAVDHAADRALDVADPFESFDALHEFCRRHAGAAYREFVVA